MHPREDDLRARGADIDTDGGQRDVILLPQRIVFGRTVVVEIMVVIMIGVVAVHMRHLPAITMIGQGVRRFGFFLFGHPVRCLASSSPAPDRPSIVRRRNPEMRPRNASLPELSKKSPRLSHSIPCLTDAIGRTGYAADQHRQAAASPLPARCNLILAHRAGE